MAQTIYEVVGGRQAFIELARAWHARCLADPIVSHAFSQGYHPHHSERLAAYWAEALGGPPEYTESMGSESSVMRMHSGNGEHQEMDERAQLCFAQALNDAGCPDDRVYEAHSKPTFGGRHRECQPTQGRQTMFPTDSHWHGGPGTGRSESLVRKRRAHGFSGRYISPAAADGKLGRSGTFRWIAAS